MSRLWLCCVLLAACTTSPCPDAGPPDAAAVLDAATPDATPPDAPMGRKCDECFPCPNGLCCIVGRCGVYEDDPLRCVYGHEDLLPDAAVCDGT